MPNLLTQHFFLFIYCDGLVLSKTQTKLILEMYKVIQFPIFISAACVISKTLTLRLQ